MAGLEHNADLAVGLEAADAGSMSGARIDDDERTAGRIDVDPFRRNDPDQNIIDRPLECAAVDDELCRVVEHVRSDLGQMLLVLIATLAQHVPEQDAALRRIDHVFDGGGERAKGLRQACARRFILIGAHFGPPVCSWPAWDQTWTQAQAILTARVWALL